MVAKDLLLRSGEVRTGKRPDGKGKKLRSQLPPASLPCSSSCNAADAFCPAFSKR